MLFIWMIPSSLQAVETEKFMSMGSREPKRMKSEEYDGWVDLDYQVYNGELEEKFKQLKKENSNLKKSLEDEEKLKKALMKRNALLKQEKSAEKMKSRRTKSLP